MLEHVPAWLGGLLRNVRAGHSKLAIVDERLGVGTPAIQLSSPAFADGARLPERFTADGEGVSPPLVWTQEPENTRSLVLIVEDPDAPTPWPMVHATMWRLQPDTLRLAEGAIAPDGDGGAAGDVARSSRGEGWLPPDPPTGHGSHDYVFQLFALDVVPDLDPNPKRDALVEAMAGHVLGAGLLVGTYSRGEELPIGAGSAQPAPA
jgi:Raf kinase inhibitor-like YbhB/YbcL family protein